MNDRTSTDFPLSRAQLGIWFADQDEAHGGRYQIAEYFDIAGPVDAAAFRCAWIRAWEETEALRVAVTDTPAGPRQSVLLGPSPDIRFLDLTTAGDPEAAALGRMRDNLTRPLDVTREPVLTVCLFRLSSRRFLWYQRTHHLTVDGFGAALFAERVAALYAQETGGPRAAAPSFGSLADLLADEEAYRASAAFDADRDFWTRKLADRPRPVSLSDRSWQPAAPVLRRTARIPADQADRLRAGLGRSLAPTAVAAVAAQLHLVTGAEDVVVSLPVTARRGDVARRTPGMLSNTVPLRLAVHGGMSFADLTRQAALVIKEALPHQRYRAEDLHRDLGFTRGERGVVGPMVNVMTFPHTFTMGGHTAVAHNLSNGPVGDIAVAVGGRQDGAGLSLDTDASSARYTEGELAHHEQTLLGLFRAAADDPQTAIGSVAVAPAPRAVRAGAPASGGEEAAPAAQAGPEPATAADQAEPGGSEAAQEAMVQLFRSVLGVAEAAPDDAFFDLGGDSITAIQLVSRARESGWAISLKQVFARETPRELAKVAVPAAQEHATAAGPAPHDAVMGPVPASPVLRWLEELGGPVDAYQQSLLIRTPAGLTQETLRTLLTALTDHHDVLRARLVDEHGWRLHIAPVGSTTVEGLVERVAVEDFSDEETVALAATHVRKAAERLDPWAGALLQACLFDGGPDRRGMLLLVVHHLAVDGASWYTLLRDLALAWEAHGAGRPIELPPVATSVTRWNGLLEDSAHDAGRLAELAHWRSVLTPDAPSLGERPLDPAVDTAATSTRRHLVLDPARSAPLLSSVPAAVHGTIPDVLLTALALAIPAWRAERGLPASHDVLLDLEGHGRADGSHEADLSRTVGWFTSMHPVRLNPADAGGTVPQDATQALARVKEQLRAAPGDGLGFGLLRHLNADTGRELRGLAKPEILFNYLGRLPGREDADWSPVPAADVLRDGRDPRGPAGHGLTIDVLVREDSGGPRLEAGFSAPAGWLRDADLDRLCTLWDEALGALAAAAAGREVSRHTPSDLYLTGLGQDEVDDLEAELERWA
ncbi:hypothetical protein C1I97_02890 [Streptomyces sp. NTH33]|uniref:condensation domain-containing protein n=1 Tax=Streptomyces sp. NTH33 TaxID=1735453 RepID=UPI000DAACEAF|nr:condensation domain-containing protein [Streptomyces sp. NTH33]PZH19197.1 hypothetical protein C1I97_02890 [Streptomyces sp. NTH33]